MLPGGVLCDACGRCHLHGECLGRAAHQSLLPHLRPTLLQIECHVVRDKLMALNMFIGTRTSRIKDKQDKHWRGFNLKQSSWFVLFCFGTMREDNSPNTKDLLGGVSAMHAVIMHPGPRCAPTRCSTKSSTSCRGPHKSTTSKSPSPSRSFTLSWQQQYRVSSPRASVYPFASLLRWHECTELPNFQAVLVLFGARVGLRPNCRRRCNTTLATSAGERGEAS